MTQTASAGGWRPMPAVYPGPPRPGAVPGLVDPDGMPSGADRLYAVDLVPVPADGQAGAPPRPIALGARCELDEEYVRGSMAALGFRVEEFAVLSDGRRVVLDAGLGWGTSARVTLEELWRFMDAGRLEQEALGVVLPDDAEETGEQHRWPLLAERLTAFGVPVSADELRPLPYEVVLGEGLRARLAAVGHGDAASGAGSPPVTPDGDGGGAAGGGAG
ncbi:MAG: hypothetical protein IRZ08_17980 [Frankia sp.]|nr:hypothetical protein [Frankia sp.]